MIYYNTPVLEEQQVFNEINVVETSYGKKISKFRKKTITLSGGVDQQYLIYVVNGMDPIYCKSTTGGPTFTRIAKQKSGGRTSYSTYNTIMQGYADPNGTAFATTTPRTGGDFQVEVEYEASVHGTSIVAHRYSNVSQFVTAGTTKGGEYRDPYEPPDRIYDVDVSTTVPNSQLLIGVGSAGRISGSGEDYLKSTAGTLPITVRDEVGAFTYENIITPYSNTTTSTNVKVQSNVYTRDVESPRDVQLRGQIYNSSWSLLAIIVEPDSVSLSSSSSTSSSSRSSSSSSSSSQSSSSSSLSFSSSSWSNASCFVEFDDDFTGNDGDKPNRQRWIPDVNNNSNSSIQSNKLNFNASNDTTSENNVYATYYLRSYWHNDFDVEIDYDIQSDTPATYSDIPNNLATLGMLYPEQLTLGGIGISRVSSDAFDGYQIQLYNTFDSTSDVIVEVASTDSTGKLRLTRVGDDLIFYYWNGSSWEWDGDSNGYTVADIDPFNVGIFLRQEAEIGGAINSNIDNFTVNSVDQWECFSSFSSSSFSSSSESSSSRSSSSESSSSDSSSSSQSRAPLSIYFTNNTSVSGNKKYTGTLEDSTIKSSSQTYNYGVATNISVGKSFPSTYENKTLMKFDLESLRDNWIQEASQITSATIGVYVSSDTLADNSYLYASRLTKDWGVGTKTGGGGVPASTGECTWRAAKTNQVAWDSYGAGGIPSDRASGSGSGYIPYTVATNTLIEVDVTDIIQNQYSSGDDYGVVLYLQEHSGRTNNVSFYSNESSSTQYKPYLLVEVEGYSISSSSRSSSSRSSSSRSSSSQSSISLSSSSSSARPGAVTWGHHTDVVTHYDRDFFVNWSLNSYAIRDGSGDDEYIRFKHKECDDPNPPALAESEVWYAGARESVIKYNQYKAGNDGPLYIYYKTGATRVACDNVSEWTLYNGVSFTCLGWVRLFVSNCPIWGV